MKNTTKAKIIAGGLAVASLFIACKDEPKEEPPVVNPDPAKNQTATLTNLFGEGYYAIVKGNFTNAEWSGVSTKINTAINGAFGTKTPGSMAQEQFASVFAEDDIVIIVEKTPNGYSKWKTSADGKTMYLAYSALNTDLQGSVDAAVQKMKVPEAGHAQIKKQNRIRYAGGMSPFELAKFQKYGYACSAARGSVG